MKVITKQGYKIRFTLNGREHTTRVAIDSVRDIEDIIYKHYGFYPEHIISVEALGDILIQEKA